MDELLNQLALQAAREGAVAQAILDDGMRLLVYPLEAGQLAVLGWPAASGHAVRGEELLQRRGADMARYGAWLPALFGDGGWYLVRRIGAGPDGEIGAPDAAALQAAVELLQ